MVGTLEDRETRPIPESPEMEDVDHFGVDLEGATYKTFDWAKYFSDPEFEFRGNVPNAAHLMQSFVKGMVFVKEKKQKEDSGLPEIIFPLGEPLQEKNVYYTKDDNNNAVVTIAKSYLENASSFDPRQNLQFLSSDNKTVIIEGSFSQIFELNGVEETFHALFEGEHPEIDAAHWKIKYANAQGFPRKTVDYLQKELRDLKSSTRRERKKNRS